MNEKRGSGEENLEKNKKTENEALRREERVPFRELHDRNLVVPKNKLASNIQIPGAEKQGFLGSSLKKSQNKQKLKQKNKGKNTIDDVFKRPTRKLRNIKLFHIRDMYGEKHKRKMLKIKVEPSESQTSECEKSEKTLVIKEENISSEDEANSLFNLRTRNSVYLRTLSSGKRSKNRTRISNSPDLSQCSILNFKEKKINTKNMFFSPKTKAY